MARRAHHKWIRQFDKISVESVNQSVPELVEGEKKIFAVGHLISLRQAQGPHVDHKSGIQSFKSKI